MDRIHLSVYAKKIKEVVKVLLFMIRKSKRKFLVDLNLALKRGKIAGKSLIGKLVHHHHHHHEATGVFNYPDPKPSDYVEFSCSNTPAHHQTNHHGNFLLSHVIIPGLSHLINGKKGGGAHKHKARFERVEEEFIMEKAIFFFFEQMEKAIECALNDAVSVYSTPSIGFGQSPTPVRQLRVTDSPYPVSSGGDSGKVDAAAENFIRRFYSQLQREPSLDG